MKINSNEIYQNNVYFTKYMNEKKKKKIFIEIKNI